MVKLVTMHDLAWAAGLFEGEGCISPRRTAAPYLWQLALSSTDEDVVRKFHEVVGVGKVYGPYLKKHPTKPDVFCKSYWRWAVSSQGGISRFGELVGPYLLSRRAERLAECLAAVALTPPRLNARRWTS